MDDMYYWDTFSRKDDTGFSRPPADIFYRATFMMKSDQEIQNAVVGQADCFACIQEQLIHVPEFRAIEDFLHMYAAVPTFQYIHLSSYSHNDLNYPKIYDEDLEQMMKRLIESGALKNKFLFLLGDHGFQRGDVPFFFTSVGIIEEKMPVAYILPPAGFESDHQTMHHNLVNNSDKLTSHFDINKMMRQLLSLSLGEPVEELFPNYEGHGVSLLEDVGDRDCETAEISENICQCQGNSANLTDDTRDALASSVLHDINQFLEPFEYCQRFSLKKVRVGNYVRVGKYRADFVSMMKLQIETSFSNIFEATFSWNFDTQELVSSKLVRLDWYRSTSNCVPDNQEFLKPFCVCS